MTRAAFVGKAAETTDIESDLLSALGMAIGLAGHDLVTTPSGGAAEAVAHGYSAATGRQPETSTKPITDEIPMVLFYDDGRIYEALMKKDPSPIDTRWTLITSIDALEDITELALGHVAQRGVDIHA